MSHAGSLGNVWLLGTAGLLGNLGSLDNAELLSNAEMGNLKPYTKSVERNRSLKK